MAAWIDASRPSPASRRLASMAPFMVRAQSGLRISSPSSGSRAVRQVDRPPKSAIRSGSARRPWRCRSRSAVYIGKPLSAMSTVGPSTSASDAVPNSLQSGAPGGELGGHRGGEEAVRRDQVDAVRVNQSMVAARGAQPWPLTTTDLCLRRGGSGSGPRRRCRRSAASAAPARSRRRHRRRPHCRQLSSIRRPMAEAR